MKAIVSALTISFLLIGCGGSASQPSVQTQPVIATPTVACHTSKLSDPGDTVFVGDSITGLWPLADYFPSPDSPIRSGIFGWRTDQIAAVFPQVLTGEKVCTGIPPNSDGIPVTLSCVKLAAPPRRIVIYAGWNNLFQSNRNGLEVVQDIESMVKQAQAVHIDVAVATLYHYDLAHPPAWWNPSVSTEPYISNLQAINPAIKALGPKYGIPVIDYEAKFTGQQGWTIDGTHPNASGYASMRDAVTSAFSSCQ